MVTLMNESFGRLTTLLTSETFFRKDSSVDGSDPTSVAVMDAEMVDFVLVVLYPQTHTILLATSVA
jgi:hypothetical protein